MAYIERRETKGKVRWVLRIYLGVGADGKRKFHTSTHATRDEANAKKDELGPKKRAGKLAPRLKTPLRDYLDEWLTTVETTIRARTHDDYKGIVRRYFQSPPKGAPDLGIVRIHNLSREHFEGLYRWMWKEGKAPRTIQYTHQVVRMALKDAVERGRLSSNPTDNATLPTKMADGSEHEDAMRAMSREQAARFLDAARQDRYYALFALLLTAGLRPSEAAGLRWSDVDLERGEVTVRVALTRRGSTGWRLEKPKTKQARRTVGIPALTVRALREWRAVQGREKLQLGSEYKPYLSGTEEPHNLVWTGPFGQPVNLVNLSVRDYRKVLERAGLGTWEGEGRRLPGQRTGWRRFKPAHRLYDLRHTFATLLMAAGEPLKVVSTRLGHKDISITANVYQHVLDDQQSSTADKMETMFGGGSQHAVAG